MNTRLERLRHYLSANELDAIVVSKPENRFYFSGFSGTSGLLLISAGSAKLLTDFRYIEQAGQQAKMFEVIRHGSDMFQTLKAEIDKGGFKRIGFESDFTTWDVYNKLSTFAAQPVAVQLDELRMVKDDAELALLEQAVLLADNAFSHILTVLKPGVSERDIALELEFHMRKNGAEKSAFDIIVASGIRSALPHGVASDKLIESGDFVTMDFGCVYHGYHSDITRTVVIGKASAKQREVYKVVADAQYAGLMAVIPGSTCREVDAVARGIIAGAGYADYFGHGLGHGVGLAIHEEPRLSPACDTKLKPNMTVTVEPGIYLPDWGGVRIEDTVLVTAHGVKVLTASSKKLIELDW
jgi:Xaa-Pro aminopeptidase